MVPMLDPMVPEATLLFAISPAFAGVVAALVGLAAISIGSALRELRRTEAPHPTSTVTATPPASSPSLRAA